MNIIMNIINEIVHCFRVEFLLTKGTKGLVWETVVQGDKRGQMVPDPELAAQIHERLAHLTSDTFDVLVRIKKIACAYVLLQC